VQHYLSCICRNFCLEITDITRVKLIKGTGSNSYVHTKLINPKLHLTNIVANMLGTPLTDEMPTIIQQVGNMLATILPPTDKILPHPNILTCRDVVLWQCCRAQQCCRAASNRNDGFDHVISDEIVVNNRTDDDASIFEQKRGNFFP